MKIVEAVKISKQSLRVIMFNFWGTIIVDVIGVSLAFIQILTPLSAALIDVDSELGFILNSASLLEHHTIVAVLHELYATQPNQKLASNFKTSRPDTHSERYNR